MTDSDHSNVSVVTEEQGERHALELADRLRMLAATEPDLAQDLVDQLIAALDRATDGTFRDHMDAGQPAPVGAAVRHP